MVMVALGQAEIAQLGERQTEDLKVPGSIPGFGIMSEHRGQPQVINIRAIKDIKKELVRRLLFVMMS